MKFDKQELEKKIRDAKDLSNEDKSILLGLLNEKKTYGLVWEDSTEDAFEQLKTQLPILREVKERQIVNDTETENYPNHILIEGENLQALVALTYTHAGMIDVIYIDPPYNTGNKDFVYNDSFIGEDDAYRHSKWLSFMEKRLQIAKTLLSERSVIFISIDDNEQANLKLLCDEVFGADKFVATIPWRKRTAKSDVPHGLSQDYEWIICYANDLFLAGVEKETRKYYETPDFPDRPWRVHDMTTQRSSIERPNCYFTIINPKTGDKYPASPNRVWANNEETFQEYYRNDRIVFPGDYDFLRISKPVLRYWKADDEKKAGDLFGFTSVSTNLPNEVGMTQDGTKDIDAVFGSKVFGFPKPLSLIKHLLKIATPRAKDIIILDFFAGSGTTLHATMQLNAEDGGHRQCILVTNNENNICEEVTYERNKRVIEGYTKPNGEFVEGLKDNNLRYYKIDFKERKQSHQSNRELFHEMKDLLCIKEDIYQEQHQFGSLPLKGKERMIRYFAENGREMLMVYDTRVIPFIVKEIEKMSEKEQPLKIYIFADGAYPYTDDFATVIDKVSLVPMPYAYYRGIKDSLPAVEPKKEDNTELTDEEQKEMMAEAIEAENNEKTED
jgi:adenine-specific DNA-methyltransferase